MKNITLALALISLLACNRDEVAANDTSEQSGANEAVVPTDAMTATTTAELVPIGGTTATSTATAATGTETATSTGVPPKDTAPAPTAEIAAGQNVYRAHCASCHGAAGRKAAGTFTLASRATQARPNEELARVIREAPSHKQLTLAPAEVEAVVAYVKALQ